MALRYGFFNSVDGDRLYNADDMIMPYKGIVSDGVIAHESKSDGFQVLEASGMSVTLKAGMGMFAGRWCELDSDMNISINPAHVTQPRIDTIKIIVDNSSSGRFIAINYTAGTPSSSPAPIDMVRDGGIMEYRLADIYVAANALNITQANITDGRPGPDCGFVTNLLQNSDISATYAGWQSQFEDWMKNNTDRVSELLTDYDEEYTTWSDEKKTEYESFIIENKNLVSESTTEYQELVEQFTEQTQRHDTEHSEQYQRFETEHTEQTQRFEMEEQSRDNEFNTWFDNIKDNFVGKTALIRYTSRFVTVDENTTEIPINIEQFKSVIDILSVYINGMVLVKDVDYTVNGYTSITLTLPISAGTSVYFTVDKSVDGTDVQTVSEMVVDIEGRVGEAETDINGIDTRVTALESAPAKTDEALWTGASYPLATDTITPSKPLSQCRTGWLLLWSDYDEASTAGGDFDYATSIIPKMKADGASWSGQSFMDVVPASLTEAGTNFIVAKKLIVHDDRIIGYAGNGATTEGKDVALRAVYEV